MNEKEKEQEKKYLEAVDVSYSYGLAKSMERIKSNPALGFGPPAPGQSLKLEKC